MALELVMVLPLVFVMAVLYTSVGHGGASGYLAVLALSGYTVSEFVTAVLAINILTAGLSFALFQNAGHLRARVLLPLVVTSVPGAALGALAPLTDFWQSAILGLALMGAAARMAFPGAPTSPEHASTRRLWLLGPPVGLALGFLAGATGIGGGVFLSPLLVMMGWATVRQAGPVAAAFIVLNSATGLMVRVAAEPVDTGFFLPMVAVAVVGALLGSTMGARRAGEGVVRRLLAVVLAVAGAQALLP